MESKSSENFLSLALKRKDFEEKIHLFYDVFKTPFLSGLLTDHKYMWAASCQKVPNVLSHCHCHCHTRPSFGMTPNFQEKKKTTTKSKKNFQSFNFFPSFGMTTTTQDIRDLFV